jgi:hypothetical protein
LIDKDCRRASKGEAEMGKTSRCHLLTFNIWPWPYIYLSIRFLDFDSSARYWRGKATQCQRVKNALSGTGDTGQQQNFTFTRPASVLMSPAAIA